MKAGISRWTAILSLLLLLGGCGGRPPCPEPDLAFAPETVWKYFSGSLACGELHHAWLTMDPALTRTSRWEEFQAAFQNAHLYKVFTEAETTYTPGIEGLPTVRVVNRDFGIDETFLIVKVRGAWGLSGDPAIIDRITDQVIRWLQDRGYLR